MNDEPAPRASFVICAYRRRAALANALRSACAQTLDRSAYEIVVVNNDPADDLGCVVDPIREEFLRAAPERLRLIVCEKSGLAYARNAGLAEARGEIVICIDDDAIADARLAEILIKTYEENADLGVVGGRILVKDPEPAPWWYDRKRSRGYWSHYDPPCEGLRRAKNWIEYPWGANWSARREALLAVGGFPAEYGRVGENYAGGEEIAAAALMERAGWGVAFQPEASVVHDIARERFTLRHVRETTRSGLMVQRRLQRAGLLLGTMTLRRASWLAFLRAGATIVYLKDGFFRSYESYCFMRGYLALARATLLAKAGREAALKRARIEASPVPPAKAGGKEESAKAD